MDDLPSSDNVCWQNDALVINSHDNGRECCQNTIPSFIANINTVTVTVLKKEYHPNHPQQEEVVLSSSNKKEQKENNVANINVKITPI